MIRKLLGVLCAATAVSWAAEKPTPSGTMSDSDIAIEALLYMKTDEIKAALGIDPGPGVVAVLVKLTPKPGKNKKIYVDDFILSSDKDGERSGPFSPAQIAGSSTMTVQESYGGYVGAEENGPIWGGVPGVGGPMGRLPGSGGGIGDAPGVTETRAEINAEDPEKTGEKKANPLLDALKAKMLQDGDVSSPRQGFLYFPLNGKHKPRQIELIYGKKRGEQMRLRFQD